VRSEDTIIMGTLGGFPNSPAMVRRRQSRRAPTRSRHDPFVDACRWAFRALVPFNPHRRRNGPRASCPEITMLVRQVRATIREAACAAAALLDQGARKIALRFPAHMRMWLCRRLVADTSGRLAQLAQACPGALIFAYALAKLGHRAGVGFSTCRSDPRTGPTLPAPTVGSC
jgi:hypothetical protein